MIELNEQIDFILEQSLDEYVKASDWKGYAKTGLADTATAEEEPEEEEEDPEPSTPATTFDPVYKSDLAHPNEWNEWSVGLRVKSNTDDEDETVLKNSLSYRDAVDYVEELIGRGQADYDQFRDPNRWHIYVSAGIPVETDMWKFYHSHPLWKKGDEGLESIVEESLIKEDKLTELVIDLDELKKNKLDESFLAMFGGWVEQILGSMFSGKSLPLSVKGSRRDVESFAKTLNGEKSYLEAARQYGLDHPTTYKNKSKLETAIKGFEKDTGIKWPFK